MHTTAAPLRTAGRATKEFGHHLLGRHAFGQRMAVTAVGAKDRILATQVGTDAHRHRFLTDIGVACAVDQAIGIRTGELLFGAADEQQLLV